MALVRIDKSFNDKAPVPTSLPSYEGGEEKNKGGLIGGVGYLGEKVAVGAVQSIEGIFDYTLGGVAKLFGFDKFAERQFANDWFGDWYDHPDEWFNPGKGWQVAGDIAGGIGTSLPTLAVGLGTGGAGLAMFGVAGLSAAGNATKEAYRETGKLGGREFAYGALTGTLEGSLETITTLVGMGTGAVIKSFGKSLGKEITESALRQGVGITLAKAFGGEAFEEGAAEIMSSRFKRWTYDPDAEHASAGQVLYVSFVGGMSGVIMGGAGTVFSTAQNISRGAQLVESGRANDVIEHAKYISEKAKKGGIEVGAMKQVEATYNKLVKSLEKTGGEVKTVAQRQMLGELKIDNIAAALSPPMYKTVAAIANDPDTFVEKLNAYGYTDSNGKVVNVTKEQLMEGLDVNNLRGTIPTALETNEVLRDIVLMSMAGEMMINTSKFQESILRGEKFAGDADLENFLRVASPEDVKAVEKLFGIKDLRTVDAETFNERVAAFQASGQYDEYLARYKAQKTASAEAVNAEDNATVEENTANSPHNTTDISDTSTLSLQKDSSHSVYGENSANNKQRITLDEFSNNNSPLWNNVEYKDEATKTRIMQEVHADMVQNGEVVTVSDEVMTNVEKSYPDLRHIKKKERTPILKEAIQKLKNDLRNFLKGFKDQNFEFEVNGKVLTAKIYSTGRNEVTENITQQKANMLYTTKEIFANARYLYSTPDYDNNTNIYRWNYFYTPVKIGNETAGVRIAIRDIAKTNESQIYHWGIKKDTSLDGVGDDQGDRNSYGASSDVSDNSIPQNPEIVNSNSKKSTGNESKDTHKALPSGESRADTVKSSKSMTVLESIKFAKENVPEYRSLNAEDQARICRLIRQAKANGFTDAQTRAYARVTARSGIDIVIDKEGLYLGKDQKTGEDVYADGVYSPERNKILVNPEGTRSPARLLIHELTHAIYKGKGRLIIEKGVKNLTDDEKQRIRDKYFKDKDFDFVEYADELNAHYTEAMLDDEALLEKLCEDNPTLPDKILSFFKKAITGYSDEPTLSREAKKLYKRYKTYFEMFADKNQYGSPKEASDTDSVRMALPDTDSEGTALSPEQREYFADTKVVDAQGQLLVLYHQTAADFTEFDTMREGAGARDNETPLGIFLKPTPDDIGLKGDKQMRLYVNITNPLIFHDRASALLHWKQNIEGYKEIIEEISNNDRKYQDLFDEAFSERRMARKLKNMEFSDLDRAEKLRIVEESSKASEKVIDEWTEANTKLDKKAKALIDDYLKNSDYDGVIIDEDQGSFGRKVKTYIALHPEQVKNVDNTAPTNNPDIRYALPDEDFDVQATLKKRTPRKLESGMTVGVMKKAIANSAHYKVYSKESALKVINSMSGTYQLTAKTRDELAQSLWQGLNDCFDADSRETFAQDMAEFITAKLINDAKIENPDVQEAAEKMSYLNTYIGKLSFSPEYISDIKHLVGKSGMQILSGRWGYKGKGNRRVPMDVFVSDISREMPAMGYLEDMHPVEAFLELNSIYQTAKDTIKDKWISAYWDMPDAEVKSLMSSIKVDILNAFIAEGEESKFSKILNNKIEYYENKAAKWKKERDNIAGRNKILGNLMSLAQKMKDLRYGNFANATQADNETFKNSIEKLAKINYRGNLPVNTTRKVMGELLTWYNKENALLEYVDDKNSGYYVQSVADMLEYLSKDENKNFSKDDLLILRDVMSYFINFVETYNKVFRDGKLVDAIPLAQKYYDIAKENANTKVGIFAKFGGSWYTELFGDPASVVRRMDYYNDGFFTEIFGDVRSAAVDAEISEMEVMKSYDDFLNSDKKYIEEATTKTVEYRDVAIPKIQLIDLYMTMKRKHAWLGIAQNGFTFTDLDGKRVRVKGLTDNAELTESELEKIIQRQRTEIEKHFDAKDKEYMSILEEGYNEKARKLKADRDMQRLGYTNATNDYYYPIRRAYLAKNVDVSDAQAEYDRVTNSSFNKDIVKGAKQELAIESADARYRRHIHAVCQYAYLSPAIEAYNRLYNLDLGGNKNRPESIRTATENTWAKGNKYFSKLISDIQGIPAVSSEGMQALSFVRGAYAKFQLGANPKVWFTQLSSIFASSSVLDADSISKGVFLASSDADKYCGLAKLRSYDNTAVMAQAVIDRQGKVLPKGVKAFGKASKFSDVLMKPIGMMDKFVVERLFGACQAQIEKNGGAKVGTERNKIEAGKLLKNVILETQQNSIATERSAAMRSGNEIVRTLTMFSSDSMKVVGRVIDAFGEISVLKQRIKGTADNKAKADLEAKLKEAHKKAAKSSTALVTSAIFMALIAQGFRWLYNKDKEDESVVKTMTVDAVGNMFGGLPLIRDVYSRIFEGYGFDNFTYSSINDLLDSAISLMDSSANIISGEATNQDIARGIKNITYSVGQLTGLPTRNVYNVLYGLTKRVAPTAAYKIDTAFYKKNYENDLYKAIEDGDAKMANFILGLLYNERMGTDMSEQTFNETLSLISKGYKVMPKAIPSTVTIAGAEYELNDTEKTALSKYYEDAQAPLRKLFEKSEYRNMSDEQKAEAINYVYNLQYKKKLVDLFGVSDKTVTLSYVISTEDLAILRIATKGLTSDVDKKGNAVSGSKRKKVVATINALDIPSVQKALLICAQGYTLQSGDVKGVTKKKLLSYILKLNTSKEVKENLAKLCGFEVKNGKIVIK